MREFFFTEDWIDIDGRPGHVEHTYNLEHQKQWPYPFEKMFTPEDGINILMGSQQIYIKISRDNKVYCLYTK